MAYVPIHGANSTAKIRNVVYVAIMVVITLGIYVIFWWYYINREMADYGRAVGTAELGDSPAKSTLALFPGALIIVPAIWTVVKTFKRVQAAQRLSGQKPLNGWLGLVTYVIFWIVLWAYNPYMQNGLNGVWRAQAAQVTPESPPPLPPA